MRAARVPTASAITVQCLVQEDRDSLLMHFRMLSSEGRRLRFGSPTSDAGLVRYVDRIDFVRDAVFGVYALDLALCGVAHLSVANETAELGVSVLDGHRGKGNGTALFGRASTWARNRGIKAIYMHCLSENAVVMHIASEAGMRIVISHGEADAHLPLLPATAATLTEEWMQNGAAILDRALKIYDAMTQRLLPSGSA
jgi:GNAT superfamily N-acetyltransferase